MKPMLAHRFQEKLTHVRFPCIIQPKLNGVRAVYRSGIFQSRDRKVWNPEVVEHILDHLTHIHPNILLDGEFYRHGFPLQKINGAIAVNRTSARYDSTEIQFWIFDLIDLEDLDRDAWSRQQLVDAITSNLPSSSPIRRCPTFLCSDRPTLERQFSNFKSRAFEGLIYRDFSAPYGLEAACTNKENRWPTLLKRKDWLDEWFPVVSFELGNGRFSSLVGSLVCQLPSGQTFTVGSGLSDEERSAFLTRLPTKAHVRYEMLSDNLIPLKPTLLTTDFSNEQSI